MDGAFGIGIADGYQITSGDAIDYRYEQKAPGGRRETDSRESAVWWAEISEPG